MNRALFLDRDGILNVDKGYVYKWEEIIWIEEVFEMMKLALDKGYKVIVLTNQSGIHRGMYQHSDVHKLHQQMSDYLKQKLITVSDWFYCAEMDSEDRKPRPGMLLAAQKKYDIDLSKSIMVGDKKTDVFETDGKFQRPLTLLVEGNYDLGDARHLDNVKIFKTHQEIVAELKKIL